MKCTQLVTERAVETELFKEKQVFQNKNKLFYSCKNLYFYIIIIII